MKDHFTSSQDRPPSGLARQNVATLSRVDSVIAEAMEPNESTALLSTTAKADVSRDHNDTSDSKTGTKNNPQILLVPFFVYCTAMGAVAVPKLNVILGLMCIQYDHDVDTGELKSGDICNSTAIHERVAQFMMAAHLISGVCCALSSQKIGALSDRYGRRPLLAFTAIGLLFGDVMSVLASWYPHQISVYWILLEFAIGGLSGTFSATMAIIQAFVVDCAEEQRRVTIFGWYHAAMFLGVAIGPVTGELLVRTLGKGNMLVVFYVAALCHALFIGFVLLVVKESAPSLARDGADASEIAPLQESRNQTHGSCRNWLSSIPRPFRVFQARPDMPACVTQGNLIPLATIDGIVFGIQVGFPAALLLYAEYNFGWQSMQANLFISLTNGIRALVLVVLLPLMLFLVTRRKLRKMSAADVPSRDVDAKPTRLYITIIQLALLADIASHAGFALSGSTRSVMLWGVPASAGAVISPIAQSLMSYSIPRERIGELFGTVSLIHALSRSVIPASMQLIYSSTVSRHSGAVFLVLSFIFALAFLLALRLRA